MTGWWFQKLSAILWLYYASQPIGQKVVFANEVSIGGVGGGGCAGGPKSRYWVVIRVANWNFLGGHVPLDGGVRFSLGPLKTEGGKR